MNWFVFAIVVIGAWHLAFGVIEVAERVGGKR